MSDLRPVPPRRGDPRLAWLPILWVGLMVVTVLGAVALAADLMGRVGVPWREPDEVVSATAVAVLRWVPLWCATNVALVTLVGLAVMVVRRAGEPGAVRGLATGVPAALGLALVGWMLLGSDSTIGPEMTDRAGSLFLELRSVVISTSSILMMLSLTYAVAASFVLARAAGRGPLAGQHAMLARALRRLTVVASIALVLGAAQVRMLYAIAVAESDRADLQPVADAWGITVGAIFSLVLIAIHVPVAINLARSAPIDEREGEPSAAPDDGGGTSGDAPAPGRSGHPFLTMLMRLEPILAVLAPFLSGLVASVAP